MSIPELATMANYQLPIKIVVMNNGHLGMVRQWQELFHQNRLCHVELDTFPDAELLAKAYGLRGLSQDDPKSLAQVLDDVVSTPGPCLLNVHVASYENVYPMVPSGAGIHEMVLGPEFDRTEHSLQAPAAGHHTEPAPPSRMLLAVLIENATGALQRILTIVTAQCCVVNSFAATPAGVPGQLHVNLALSGDARALTRVALRISKLVNVLETSELDQNVLDDKAQAQGLRAGQFQHGEASESAPPRGVEPGAPLLLVNPKAC